MDSTKKLYWVVVGNKIDGHHRKLSGNTSNIYGDCTKLKGIVSSKLSGDVSNIEGDVTNVTGCCTGMKLNLDDIDVIEPDTDINYLTAVYGEE